MLRAIWILALCGTLMQVLGQDRPKIIIDTQGEVHPWNNLEVNNDPARFQFAIVTDRTGGHRPGVFPTAIQKLNLLQPEFVMSVGDLIEGYTNDVDRINQEWEEFNGFIDSLTVPFFYVPGNHDYINETMAAEWKKRFGQDYYHFVYQDVLFLCLNSEERMRGAGRGYIDKPQLEYIETTLADHPEVKWTMVFVHQPLWDQEDPGEWPAVEAALADRPHTVFAGHRHRYVKYEQNGGKYFVLATTGGGSSLRGTRFGEFDHVVWITMTDNGPIMANLMLDGIWDEDVNTEEMVAFSRPLMGSQAVKVSPLMVQGEEQPTSVEVRLTNNSDVPMAYEVAFESNERLWLAANTLQDTLPPNQTLVREIPIQGDFSQPFADISPVAVAATVTYLPEDQPELELLQRLNLRPETMLGFGTRQVELDGQLDEWETLRFDSRASEVEADPFSHDGVADASFTWDLAYDESFIYLAANFKDDDLEVQAGSSPWNQDGAALLVDARPMKQSAYNNGEGWYRAYLPLLISPSESEAGKGSLYRADNLPEGTRFVCQLTEEGYAIEAAIPVSYVEQMQGEAWQHLRINVIQQDFDDDGMHESRVLWQPDWRSTDRLVGAGTFRKE